MDPSKNQNVLGDNGPTRPLHIVTDSWMERVRKLGDYIRSTYPLEGKWEGRIEGVKLLIPIELQSFFLHGGVVTYSAEDHLMLFGPNHWNYYQYLLAKQNLDQFNSPIQRHIYGSMVKFDRLNDDGSITLTKNLIEYAGLEEDVAIIGVEYHAEIHDRTRYFKDEKLSAIWRRNSFKKLFKKG